MDTPRNSAWLDTETKAALQKLVPEELAPATTDTFAVVVLSQGSPDNRVRRTRAFDRVLRSTLLDAERQTESHPPFVVKRGLTLSDAMLAQFELICCDIISVFLSDHVVSNAEPEYLASLYRGVAQADEFEALSVRVVSIPADDAGLAFSEQFIGSRAAAVPFDMVAMRKKARIMIHWAEKIGANVVVMPHGT
ncbi:MAG: hypothetical protein U1E05_17770 [Patescibacteria group bacterium]|nr:hypothetical protein [Patescibacteria group bacterium]